MNQDEIIEMARASGFMPAHDNRVQHFAKLVAAKAFPDGVDAEWIARRTKYAVEQEREACAKMCDATEGAEGKDLAKAIRARGKA
jgi:hypothetical protein